MKVAVDARFFALLAYSLAPDLTRGYAKTTTSLIKGINQQTQGTHYTPKLKCERAQKRIYRVMFYNLLIMNMLRLSVGLGSSPVVGFMRM